MTTTTFSQAALCCSILIVLSAATAPLSLLSCVCAYLWTAFRRKHRYGDARDQAGRKPKIALLNGGRMQKAVFVSRALAAKGYRVILVEERGWGEVCAARFSNSVDRFFLVPGGGGKRYVDGLAQLMIKEKVDLFVPCSGAGTTLEDAEVAEIVRRASKGKVQTLIQDRALAETLHEKNLFVRLVLNLGLDAPASHLIRSPVEAMQLLRQDGQPPLILKAVNVLDDIGRSDLTTFPLRNRNGRPDWNRTERRLSKELSIPMTPKTPYIAQEFVGGPGASEWCTHATVHDGKITAFACCPSNDMLMTYHNATYSLIGRRALAWTILFLSRLAEHADWKGSRLTGQFSMDFIHQPSSDRLVVIECNPRVHTAIGLLTGSRWANSSLGDALQGSSASAILMPPIGAGPMSWLGHDLIARKVLSLVPGLLCRPLAMLHPLWTRGDQAKMTHPLFNLEASGKDGAWDLHDPFVFFALYHIQMPFLLLRQLFLRRRAYSRINISTARIFEC